MENPIINIDWKQLREQKEVLVDIQSKMVSGEQLYQIEAIEGIVSLIDSIQDYAVDELGIENSLVFELIHDNDDDNVRR